MYDIPLWDKGRINESVHSSHDLDISYPEIGVQFKASLASSRFTDSQFKRSRLRQLLKVLKDSPNEDPLIRSLARDFDAASGGRFRKEVCEFLASPDEGNFEECIIFIDHYFELEHYDKVRDTLSRALENYKDEKMLYEQLLKYQTRIDGYN